jgi:hypothetical protein
VKAPEERTETSETSSKSEKSSEKSEKASKSGGWLSRAFAKATGRTSGRGGRGVHEERKTSVTSGVTSRTSSRATTTVKEGEGSAAEATTAARDQGVEARGVRGKGANGTTKKMRVEDFEPLKLIGRGAFGA